MSVEITKAHIVHGGTLSYAHHQSAATGTKMTFSVFTPPGNGPFAYLIWLSGLTCTEDNFTTKAGAYAYAAQHGVAIVAPDTSPRGEGVADDPAYDLGQGAGFYVDATQAPWAPHFKMESYVTRDLIAAVGSLRAEAAARHLRALDGWPRRAHACDETSAAVQKRLGVRTDLVTNALPVGRQSTRRVPRPKS